MKLKSTLSDRGAGFLYTAPLMDVVMLLLIFFLFGSNFVLKSGVAVDLPSSSSSLPTASQAHIITIVGGETEQVFFNESQVDMVNLGEILTENRKHSDQIILLGDEAVSYGTVMQVSQLALQSGYDLSFATREETP